MSRVYNLGQLAITGELTAAVITTGVTSQGGAQALIDRLDGMNAVTLEADFDYGGSGGTTCIVRVQTRLGAGGDWIDIARLDFATTSARKACTINGLAAKAVAAVAALGAEGVLDGILGDALRAVVTSTGTYGANTNLAVRAAVR